MSALVISAAKAARYLGVGDAEMLRLLAEGEIDAYRNGRFWKVPVKALETYVTKRAASEAQARREIFNEEGRTNETVYKRYGI